MNNTHNINVAVASMLYDESNKYHLTLSPRKGFDLRYLEKSFNQLMMLMNERLYGKRYKNQGNHIHGIVVLEHAEKENPHFHVIIRDPNDDLENKRTFGEALEQVLPKIKTSVTDKNSRRLIGPESFSLQKYFNDGSSGLERYLSKEFKEHGGIRAMKHLDNLSPLNADGVLFGARNNRFPFSMRTLSARA